MTNQERVKEHLRPCRPIGKLTELSLRRFMARVKVTKGCWTWRGQFSQNGYGRFQIGAGLRYPAHRVSYTIFKGRIPFGLLIHHKCENTACVNPEHLRPATNKENVLLGHGATARNAKKTTCLRGHKFTPENTRYYGNSRKCLSCDKSRMAKKYEEKKNGR